MKIGNLHTKQIKKSLNRFLHRMSMPQKIEWCNAGNIQYNEHSWKCHGAMMISWMNAIKFE